MHLGYNVATTLSRLGFCDEMVWESDSGSGHARVRFIVPLAKAE